jgi:hypothetical protein
MIQRHQDYQLTIAEVPVGGIAEIPLQLDSDAMFSLRAIRTRNLGASGFRFQYADKRWESTELRTDWNQPTAAGQTPRPQRGGLPLYPELIYPTSSQIVFQVGNTTAAPLTNVRILCRGSKWFTAGLLNPTYPKSMSAFPFTYPVAISIDPVQVLRDIPFTVDRDADFVYRYGVADPGFLGVEGGPIVGTFQVGGGDQNPQQTNYEELYVSIKDEARKPFSNEPIHINDLFGQGVPFVLPAAGGNDDPVLWFPGKMTPEIYIQAEHSLYLDLHRSDAGSGWFPQTINFRFQGCKVFKR